MYTPDRFLKPVRWDNCVDTYTHLFYINKRGGCIKTKFAKCEEVYSQKGNCLTISYITKHLGNTDLNSHFPFEGKEDVFQRGILQKFSLRLYLKVSF